MGLILDSSVVIAGERRGHSVREILEQIETACGETEIGPSVVTIAELMHGAYRANSDVQQQRRLGFIDRLCNDVPVHSVTIGVARMAGRIDGEQSARGIRVAFEDLMIGATALYLGFAVATLNVRDFKRIPGLSIVTG